MRSQIARFLLLLFLLQSTVLGELLKLPLLIQHYDQHVQLHPGTTISGFLKMHYLDKTIVDEDYAQDMQLPFKTLDNHNLAIQLSMPPVVAQVLPFRAFHLLPKIGYLPSHVAFSFTDKVFQPPKTV